MMDPHPFLLLPLLFLLLPLLSPITTFPALAVNGTSFCSTNCSTLHNVAFPFGTRPGCGLPSFLLTCPNDLNQSPLWKTSAGTFFLLKIAQIDLPSDHGSVIVKGSTTSNCPISTLHTGDDIVSPHPVNGVHAINTIYLLRGCQGLSFPTAYAQRDTQHCMQWYDYCQSAEHVNLNDQDGPGAACFEVLSNYTNHANISDLFGNLQCKAYTTVYNVSSQDQNISNSLSFGMGLQWDDDLISRQQIEDCEKCQTTTGSCGYDSSGSLGCICGPDGQFSKTDCSHHGCKGGLCSGSAKAGLAVGVILLGALLALIFVFCFCKRRGENEKVKSAENLINADLEGSNDLVQIFANQIGTLPTKSFTYKELEEATKSFSESRMIGDGGFGAVYEGRLYDGRKVAVKRLYHENHRRLEQFGNEVKILSYLQHPNLVKLFGYCLNDKDLLLVYEYVCNGTLADHLHGDRTNGLSWEIRLSIALETAEAICYLHYSVNPPIFHRDVKSSNILVDERFHAKVADFGLSRLVPLDATHVSTVPQGTPGYLDPDYHQCYQLTQKSDVYSFGVVLMEIISSRLPVDMSRNKKEINLANFAVAKIQSGELDELVDPSLEISLRPAVREMVSRVVELAFKCLSLEKDDRPTMKEVAEELASIKQFGSVDETALHYTGKSNLKSTIPYSPNSVQVVWPSSTSISPLTSTSDVKE